MIFIITFATSFFVFGLFRLLAIIEYGKPKKYLRLARLAQKRIDDIAAKIEMVDSLKKKAVDNLSREDSADIVLKQETFLKFLYEYLDEYEAGFLLVRASELKPNIIALDSLVEYKSKVINESEKIIETSLGLRHSSLLLQRDNIKSSIEVSIKQIIENQTGILLSTVSPLRHEAQIKSAKIGKAIDLPVFEIEDLNAKYDLFIAEASLA